MEEQKDYWRNEAVAFLALSSIKGVGYWTLHKISDAGKSFERLLKAGSPKELEKHLRISLPDDSSWSDYQRSLWAIGIEAARNLHQKGIQLFFRDQEEFPQNLREIHDSPQWIFVQGSIRNLHKKTISIVGTRKPTDDGIFLTKIIVASIANRGTPTVSGLATGIDQTAHTESIRYNIPTIAVLGNGIFVEFPSGSDALKDKIIAHGGTIVTEYLPYQTYSGENFVRRNRIQAALCNTLFPVEWKIKSGTAHTVEYAYKYKKKIANVFLPLTYDTRPELAFAEKNRNAKSWELPSSINLMMEFLDEEEMSPHQSSLDL
tara:strand:- start:40418 stop:41371 length:954 start_codon:yes stop_codon:yes gene_type:complete